MSAIHTSHLRFFALAIIVVYGAACGGDNRSAKSTGKTFDAQMNDVPVESVNSGTSPLPVEARELTFSDENTLKKSVFQCFCAAAYRNTLLLYHFVDQNSVLVIQFDNMNPVFPAIGSVFVFNDTDDQDAIRKWINNKHSDGLYFDAAVPIKSLQLDTASITLTSRAFVESLNGFSGDRYERYRVEFTVDNVLEEGVFFLSSFSDQTDVYLQIQPPSIGTE